MSATVAEIRRYPVKGMTTEWLDAVDLEVGQAIPGDRRFALALGSTPVEGARVQWMPKTGFLTLLRHEKLATVTATFEDATGTLAIQRGGRQVAKGDITTPIGRAMIEEFIDAYMGEEARGRPRLVEAADGAVLSDVPDAVVSIINLASVKDLERVTGQPLDPVRFRGNLYVAGLEPWAEFGWVGRELSAGGARLRVTQRIARCAATSVDPSTGARDINVPAALKRGYGHADMGVYATVVGAGRLAAGDPVAPSD